MEKFTHHQAVYAAHLNPSEECTELTDDHRPYFKFLSQEGMMNESRIEGAESIKSRIFNQARNNLRMLLHFKANKTFICNLHTKSVDCFDKKMLCDDCKIERRLEQKLDCEVKSRTFLMLGGGLGVVPS